VEALADRAYRSSDIAAAISSGPFRPAGMVVAPCSMKTVSGIATSFSDNLLLRAADVVLKERRRLLLLVRETPLHLGQLRLLVQVAEIGEVVMPPMPAFYHRPATLAEVVDQSVNRVAFATCNTLWGHPHGTPQGVRRNRQGEPGLRHDVGTERSCQAGRGRSALHRPCGAAPPSWASGRRTHASGPTTASNACQGSAPNLSRQDL